MCRSKNPVPYVHPILKEFPGINSTYITRALWYITKVMSDQVLCGNCLHDLDYPTNYALAG